MMLAVKNQISGAGSSGEEMDCFIYDEELRLVEDHLRMLGGCEGNEKNDHGHTELQQDEEWSTCDEVEGDEQDGERDEKMMDTSTT